MTTKINTAMAAFVLAILFSALPAMAQHIYKWQDSKGLWNFSQQIPEGAIDRDHTESLGDFHAGTSHRLDEILTKKISERCEREWPGKFSMQVHYRDRQHQSLLQLGQGKPKDIPTDKYTGILRGCIRKWTTDTDFALGAYCVKRETDAYRNLVTEQ
jgi:hypothetical protein